MKNLFILFLILFLSCSGSKQFDQTPTPIGGEEQVRWVLTKELGEDYYTLSRKRLRLSIQIDKNGVVEKVIFPVRATNWTEDIAVFESKIKNAFMNHIKFTPAIQDGKPIAAEFEYQIIF